MFLRGAAKLDTVQNLFVSELKDTFDAGTQVMDAIPKIIDAATSDELKGRFRQYRDLIRSNMDRIEDIFEMLDMEPQKEHCDGMAGILKDTEKAMHAEGDSNVKDTALIAAAKKMECYQTSCYSTLDTLAHAMGSGDFAEKLKSTLEQTWSIDDMLSSYAARSAKARNT